MLNTKKSSIDRHQQSSVDYLWFCLCHEWIYSV